MLIFIWSTVEFNKASPLAEPDHVLQTMEVSMIKPDGNLLREGDWLKSIFKNAEAITSTNQPFHLEK